MMVPKVLDDVSKNNIIQPDQRPIGPSLKLKRLKSSKLKTLKTSPVSSFSSTAQGIQAILGANRKKMLWKWAKWWKMFGNGGNGRNGGTSMQWTPIRHLLSLVERAALQRTAESIRVLNRIQILNASLFNNAL